MCGASVRLFREQAAGVYQYLAEKTLPSLVGLKPDKCGGGGRGARAAAAACYPEDLSLAHLHAAPCPPPPRANTGDPVHE